MCGVAIDCPAAAMSAAGYSSAARLEMYARPKNRSIACHLPNVSWYMYLHTENAACMKMMQ
jgi:hypothetical protein